MKILFRREDMRLLGVHVIGDQAVELLHIGLIALLAEAGADLFNRACFSYPTLGDLCKYSANGALAQRDGIPNLRQVHDPAKVSAEVSREIAGYLAILAGSLEDAGHSPKITAEFLTRCLFFMFAEDVGLLPKDDFRGLLESLRQSPEGFVPKLRQFTAAQLAKHFLRAKPADLAEILETLATLGRAHRDGERFNT